MSRVEILVFSMRLVFGTMGSGRKPDKRGSVAK